MHRKQWIFDRDGTLTDSMTVVWQGAPLELLRRYGRTARPGIHDVLLSMGMVEGAEYLIRTYTTEGQTVLDNYSGSGTTAVAAHQSDRRYICIEQDVDYYLASCERVCSL